MRSSKKTKIVATIGPATESEKQLEKLFKAGVDVVRLNFSHNTHEWHQKIYERVERVSKKLGKKVAVLQDLSGPKIRIGELPEEGIELKKGKKLILTTKNILGDEKKISVNYKKLPQEVKKGDIIKIEDGKKTLLVEKTRKDEIETKIIDGGFLTSHKGMNIPGVKLSISSLTPKDKGDVLFAIKNKLPFVAFSFVQTKDDVLELRKILKKHGSDADIIVKIETASAVENFDEILKVTDGVMIARGDLAIEIGVENVPLVQKEIIAKCNGAGKPVITATQMLDSMEHSPIPTRAEVSDVANAILDGTDALMLSGETSIGKFPIKAVNTMVRIAKKVEPFIESKISNFHYEMDNIVNPITESAVRIAEEVGAKYIVTLTQSGFTTRMISRFKPSQKIIALTPIEKTAEKISLIFAAEAIVMKEKKNIDKEIEMVISEMRKRKIMKKGDRFILTMGYPFGKPKSTNKIIVLEI